MHNTIQEMIQITHERILNYRRIKYFIATKKFEIIYNSLKDPDRAVIESYILLGSYLQLIDSTKNILKESIETYNIKQLRKLAAKFSIPFYFTMCKAELLSRILNASTDAGRNEATPIGDSLHST